MQRTCLWRLLAALLAVSLAIGYSVNEYYFSHSWNETVDHDGIERKSVLKRVTLGAELNPGFRKAEIVNVEAAPGGERVGGGERPADWALSLNGDDEGGDTPGGGGFGAGPDAGPDVTRARAASTKQISRRLHAVATRHPLDDAARHLDAVDATHQQLVRAQATAIYAAPPMSRRLCSWVPSTKVRMLL
jgi:hypothetical protein